MPRHNYCRVHTKTEIENIENREYREYFHRIWYKWNVSLQQQQPPSTWPNKASANVISCEPTSLRRSPYAKVSYVSVSNMLTCTSWGNGRVTCMSSSKLSCKLFPRVVFLYSWYAMVETTGRRNNHRIPSNTQWAKRLASFLHVQTANNREKTSGLTFQNKGLKLRMPVFRQCL